MVKTSLLRHDRDFILVKGPPKGLDSATIEINISWGGIMFGCCPRIQIYALRPPLLIFALKTVIKIS